MHRIHKENKWPTYIAGHIENAAPMPMPLADNHILSFQEKFLSTGFHAICVSNMQQGRDLICTFLGTLLVYHEVACLTTDPYFQAEHRVIDIYDELINGGYLSSLNEHQLDAFITNHLYADFMWIEASPDMSNAHWFDQLIMGLVRHKIDQKMPILLISSET